MTDFDQLFIENEGHPIRYKNKILMSFDEIKIEQNDVFEVNFESADSEWIQGFMIQIKGHMLINNEITQKAAVFWVSTAPQKFSFIVVPTKKEGSLIIKNTWDPFGDGSIHSWTMGAAMIREDIPNGARYYCNDGHYDEDFDDLIFTIVKTKGTWEAQTLEVID